MLRHLGMFILLFAILPIEARSLYMIEQKIEVHAGTEANAKNYSIDQGESVELYPDFLTIPNNAEGSAMLNLKSAEKGPRGEPLYKALLSSGMTVYLNRENLLKVLKSKAYADPEGAMDRFNRMNRSAKNSNCPVLCKGCEHAATKDEAEAFRQLSKSDHEMEIYHCAFKGSGREQIKLALPILRDLEQVTGFPAVYVNCIVENESAYTNLGSSDGSYGVGHFTPTTARAVAEETAKIVREMAKLKNERAKLYRSLDAKQATEMITKASFDKETAPYQLAAIAANAKRLLEIIGQDLQRHPLSENQLLPGVKKERLLEFAAYGHNAGERFLRELKSEIVKDHSSLVDGVIVGTEKRYIEDVRNCMRRLNYNKRSKDGNPDFKRCENKK